MQVSGFRCRGSIALGSGCRRCEKCREELAYMQNKAAKEDAFQIDATGVQMGTSEAPTPGKIEIAGAQTLSEWRKDGDTLMVSGVVSARDLKLEDRAAGAQGLPVAGYKTTQPQWAIDLVNENKVLEEKCLRQLDRHVRNRDSVEIDQRSVQMARGLIEDAFMRLNRAVFQPQRLQGDLE